MNNPAIKKSEYTLAIFGLGLLLLAVATSLHYKNLNLFILELFCDVVAVICNRNHSRVVTLFVR